ncbi:hypothetical protein [Virgibacillus sp. DJP39]|uniref:hypothetical protein n=1 Tax=Virgibacillus sp. DJP39 TaxID=3409790 RepID=UPI003BB5F499
MGIGSDIGGPSVSLVTYLLWQEIMSSDGGKGIEKIAFPSDRTSALKEYGKEKLTRKSQFHPYLT